MTPAITSRYRSFVLYSSSFKASTTITAKVARISRPYMYREMIPKPAHPTSGHHLALGPPDCSSDQILSPATVLLIVSWSGNRKFNSIPDPELTGPASSSLLPGRRPSRSPQPSVGIEDIAVIELQRRILPLLAQQAVAGDQHLDLAAHEAAERVFRRAVMIGSPRTLKLVLTRTPQPVFALKFDSSV